MATEKLFNNVRLGMKVDTLENWGKSTLKLKRGELAFATVAASAGTGLTEPVVMVKIGTSEEKTFAELPWSFYAKASDVLEVAKDTEKLTAFVNNLITNADLVDNDAMNLLIGRVEATEDAIELLNEAEDKAGSVANSIKVAIEALDLANTYVAQEDGKSLILDTEITRLSGMSDGANKVEASETNGNIKIDGTEVVVYTHPDKHAIDDVTGLQTALDGKVDKVDGKSLVDDDEITKLAGISTGANKVEKSDTNGSIKVDGAEVVVYTHPDKHAMGDITGLDTALAGKADKATTLAGYNIADAYTKDEVDEFIEAAKKHADDNDANFTYSIAYDSTNKKIQLVGANGGATTDIDATAFIKDGMIETVALSDDGENLVITWNTDAGKENSVTTIPLSGLVDVYTGVDGTTVKVDVSSKNEIGAEVKAGTITTSHIAADAGIVKTQLNADVQASLEKADSAIQAGDIADLNDKKHEHANKALLDTYDQTNADITDAVAKKHSHTFVDSDVDDAITKKHAHENKGLLDTYTQTEANLADAVAKKHSHTFADNDVVDAIDKKHTHENATVLAGITAAKVGAWDAAEKNAKDYADGLAKDYATAAQGGKADTAVQTVDGATGSGLKATKTGTSVTVDFDDSITFVFNCGTSADIE